MNDEHRHGEQAQPHELMSQQLASLTQQLATLTRQLTEIRYSTEQPTLLAELAVTRGRLEGVERGVESTVRALVKRAVDAEVRFNELTRWCDTFRLEGKFSSERFAQAAARSQKGSEICILNTFIPNLPDIAEYLTEALDRGVSVRILVLRRKCREVKYRAETLGRSLDHVEEQIEQTLDNIRDKVYAKAKISSRHLLMVRVFECWPPFAMYATDGQVMVGYYLHGELAVDGPQLVLSARHESFATFKEQFNDIWKLEHTRDLAMPDWRMADDLLDYKPPRD
jgi:hypothetical protein